MNIENKLRELGLIIPQVSAPMGNYIPVSTVEIYDPVSKEARLLLYTCGLGPKDEEGNPIVGKLGRDLTIEEGITAARSIGLSMLALLREHLGSLNRVEKAIKLAGMVNADPDFTEHPTVINGCSDLLVEVFGEAGRHARSAVGMSSLPGGIAVEIEGIFEAKIS